LKSSRMAEVSTFLSRLAKGKVMALEGEIKKGSKPSPDCLPKMAW
jgi:hypothetical protein